MKQLRSIVIIAGLVGYAVAFYVTPLPEVQDDRGHSLLRIDLLKQLVLIPDKVLLPIWFGAPAEFSLFDRVPVLAIAGLILAWAAVLGWLALGICSRLFCRNAKTVLGLRLTPLEQFIFSAAIGLNVLSTWVLFLGLFGMMGSLSMVWLPMLVTFAAAGFRWKTARQKNAVVGQIGNPPNRRATTSSASAFESPSAISPCWLWLGLPFVLAIILAAMLPPLDFDVREYHLQAPKEFFQQGRITFLPHNVYANMAMGTEMLSLLAMVVSGDWWLGALAGKTVIAAFTPLTALALLAIGRRLTVASNPAEQAGTPPDDCASTVRFSTLGIVAALAYLSVPWVVSIASGGFVEGASACYLLLAVYALLLGNQSTIAQFALSGYFAGSAVATKYPAALFVFVPLAAWVAYSQFQRQATKQPAIPADGTVQAIVPSAKGSAIKALGVFVLCATLACGLWFAKNWILTGNPTYPLLYGLFDVQSWTPEKDQQWNRVHRPHDFSIGTFTHDMVNVALTSPWLSPLVVPLAVLAFVGRKRRLGLAWALLAYIGFVVGTWWLCTHRIDRFWIPIMPIMALLAGIGACWSTARWWRATLVGLLIVGLGANFLVAGVSRSNAWFVRLTRLRNAPGWIDPWHAYFNANLTEGRLLLVGDAAPFDLKPPVLYNTCFDDCILEQIVKGRTAAEVRAMLASRRIAYVYVDWGEIDRYRKTYGYTDFVQPDVLERLVAWGVLERLPRLEQSQGEAFRVKT